MNDQLPAPLVPPDVDLRGLDYMPLFGNHLFGSEFNAMATDEAWRAGVTLWWAAWNQQPAGSLPDNDTALCRLADLGRDVKGWKQIRDVALRGFKLCSDGRLYHPFLCKQALVAWEKRVKERERKADYRAKKAAERAGHSADVPRDNPGTKNGTETGTGPGQDADVRADGNGRDVTGRDVTTKPKPPESSLIGINTIAPPAEAAESDVKGDDSTDPDRPSTATRQGLVSALLRELGVQITPGNPHLVGWVQAGVTDEQLREAVARVRLHKPEPEPIPSNYLAKTVLSVLHPPEIPALTAVPSDSNLVPRWWESEAATTEQAKRLGMHARGGEGWAEFRQRIRDRLTAIRTEAAA